MFTNKYVRAKYSYLIIDFDISFKVLAVKSKTLFVQYKMLYNNQKYIIPGNLVFLSLLIRTQKST